MSFDIGTYTRTSRGVAWDDLDFDEFRRNPLPPDTLRTVRYMCDVEYHTVCYLRDMLVTPSHKEPDVTAFMTMWNMEEFWHGEALAAVLGQHGVTVDYDELKARRLKLGWKDRFDPIKHALIANVMGQDYVAVHMIWGAANEWSAITAYNRLAELQSHPVLAQLLERIARQEAKHVAFYATQARERLARSTKAQKFARFALKRFWGPVGSGIMDETEVKHVLGHLMSGPDGRAAARKIDDHISKMPGLSGLRIVEKSLDVRGIPA
jgi:hypothetical protein